MDGKAQPYDHNPFDAFRKQVEEAVGHLARRVDAIADRQKALDKRLDSLNTMIEERDQH